MANITHSDFFHKLLLLVTLCFCEFCKYLTNQKYWKELVNFGAFKKWKKFCDVAVLEIKVFFQMMLSVLLVIWIKSVNIYDCCHETPQLCLFVKFVQSCDCVIVCVWWWSGGTVFRRRSWSVWRAVKVSFSSGRAIKIFTDRATAAFRTQRREQTNCWRAPAVKTSQKKKCPRGSRTVLWVRRFCLFVVYTWSSRVSLTFYDIIFHQELLRSQAPVQTSLQVLLELGEQLKQQVDTSAAASIQSDHLTLAQRLNAVEQSLSRQQAVLQVRYQNGSVSDQTALVSGTEVFYLSRLECETTRRLTSSWTLCLDGSWKLKRFWKVRIQTVHLINPWSGIAWRNWR